MRGAHSSSFCFRNTRNLLIRKFMTATMTWAATFTTSALRESCRTKTKRISSYIPRLVSRPAANSSPCTSNERASQRRSWNTKTLFMKKAKVTEQIQAMTLAAR